MKNRFVIVCTALLLAGCAGGAPPAQPAEDPSIAAWRGDTLLAPLLTARIVGRIPPERADSLAGKTPDFDQRLAAVVRDTTAPVVVRINALMLLSDRKVEDLSVYSEAIRAKDESVRAAAIVAMRPFQAKWRVVPVLIRDALNDSSKLVQMKALESINDAYISDVRVYALETKDPAMRAIAEDLVRSLEERGAPFASADVNGAMVRTTATGHRINFRPVTRWPKWDAAVGELWLAAGNRPYVRISGGVEAVANVVPAFISPDGNYLIYEAERKIHVRDLRTDADRIAGDGVAPRLIPLSEGFIYLRDASMLEGEQYTSIQYDVVYQPLSGGELKVLGQISAQVRLTVRGNYSPVRWMRVREVDGQFLLSGDTIEPFKLPDSLIAK